MFIKKLKPKRGFTLIEIMTAMSVFAIVVTISLGSILAVFDVNRKSESIKAVMDNLNLALESMAREMRFGKNYICNPSLPISGVMPSPQNCNGVGNTSIAFLANDGVTQIAYRLNGTTIDKSRDGGANWIPLTAPGFTINKLNFYVFGALPSGSEGGNPQQPKVFITVQGTAGTKASSKTDFTIQTLVSQRQLDL